MHGHISVTVATLVEPSVSRVHHAPYSLDLEPSDCTLLDAMEETVPSSPTRSYQKDFHTPKEGFTTAGPYGNSRSDGKGAYTFGGEYF